MSDHDEECSAMEILPHALVCLNHLQMVHFESDITAYFGQASAQSDIYVISGAETRRRVQEFINGLNAEKIAEKREASKHSAKDVAELYRMFNKSVPSRRKARRDPDSSPTKAKET
jgi:hypothetical protein